MHRYLRAIGFSEQMKNKDEQELCHFVETAYEQKCVYSRPDQTMFCELQKEVGMHIGVDVRGEYSEEGRFLREYYFPYFKGRNLAMYDTVFVERHADKDSFAGICENLCAGQNVIFYLQNAAEYLKYIHHSVDQEEVLAVTLSALSVEGCILLPVQKKCPSPQPACAEHTQMAERARGGDVDALENMALEDMDMYTALSRRVKREDVYSIVDSYFMPYGIECDQYSVLGEIVEMETVKNALTGETVYFLNLRCNELNFDVCINAKDLVGEPAEGRRFKGVIWLQGYVALA